MDTNLAVLKKPRSIQKSFRYSEDIAEILEQVEGDNTNDKFNNLVLFCFNVVPDIEKTIQRLKDDQQTEYKKLMDIQKRIGNVRSLIGTLESLERYGQMAERQLKHISEGLDDSGRKSIAVICDTEFDDEFDEDEDE